MNIQSQANYFANPSALTVPQKAAPAYPVRPPVARIYQPARSVMQSAPDFRRPWRLEFEPSRPKWREPLMGWTASDEALDTVRIGFPDKESAIAFAESHGLKYRVFEPHRRRPKPKSYIESILQAGLSAHAANDRGRLSQPPSPKETTGLRRNAMTTLEVNGKTIETTPDGFLVNPNDWDDCVMEALIQMHEAEGNPEVGGMGRLLIKFFRDYYEDRQVHPSMNRILRMWEKMGEHQINSEDEFRDALYKMFPRGPIPALAKLAGLPEPAVEEEFDAG